MIRQKEDRLRKEARKKEKFQLDRNIRHCNISVWEAISYVTVNTWLFIVRIICKPYTKYRGKC